MWARHMSFPFRKVLPAFAPYTEAIAFESATELLSSVFAAAGNDFEPVTPALVAFIASTACSANRLSSETRRLCAVSVDLVMPIIGLIDEGVGEDASAPATSRPETTSVAAAAVSIE